MSSYAKKLALAFTSTGGSCELNCNLYCSDLEHYPSAVSLLKEKFIEANPNKACTKSCFLSFGTKLTGIVSRSCEETSRCSIISEHYVSTVVGTYSTIKAKYRLCRTLHPPTVFCKLCYKDVVNESLIFLEYYGIRSDHDLDVHLTAFYEDTFSGWNMCENCCND